MDSKDIKPKRIKGAGRSTDPLVKELFDLMDRLGKSAKDIESLTAGIVMEETILQWRTRSTPTITNLRLCFEALGFVLVAKRHGR